MDDLPTILHLIDEAKGWLKSKIPTNGPRTG